MGEKLTFMVTGEDKLHCESCEARAGKALKRLPGVKTVKASHQTQQVEVSFGMIGSMSRKDNCWDNACIESWDSLLKKELIYLRHFHTREQAQLALFEYIEIFYNRQRLHGVLGSDLPQKSSSLLNHRDFLRSSCPKS